MPAWRVSDAAVIAAAGVLIVALGAAGAVVAPAPDPAEGTSSTYSSAPPGTRAAYLTLRRLGYDVQRSVEPLTALTAQPERSVLILSGAGEPSAQDQRALKRFLERGGVVLAIGQRGAEFLGAAAKGRPAPALLPTSAVQVHRAVAASPIVAGAHDITMAPDLPAVSLGNAYVTLYGDESPVAATTQVGKGRVVWLAAATPLSNEHIAANRNFQLLLNIVGPPNVRTIIWDEHYHGYTRSLWSYVAGTPVAWILLQVSLVAGAALFTYSRRHGPVRALFTDTRTSPVEFVEMLGALYKRAGARAAAVAASRARLRRTIAGVFGMPPQSTDAAIARAAASKLNLAADEIEAVLTESDRAASDGALDSARALTLTRQLQAMTARIQAVRR
jgi:hypothetical protein